MGPACSGEAVDFGRLLPLTSCVHFVNNKAENLPVGVLLSSPVLNLRV